MIAQALDPEVLGAWLVLIGIVLAVVAGGVLIGLGVLFTAQSFMRPLPRDTMKSKYQDRKER